MKTKIWIAGHNGMVGSSLLRFFSKKKKYKILKVDKNKLNLLNQKKVFDWLKKNKPNIVINAAAIVGGIKHNSDYPAEFIYENLTISTNIIHGSFLAKVDKLINLGSACIYPKFSKQPIKEEYLLSGKLEKTNEAYAIAKIASLKMCEYYNRQFKCNYFSLQPTNLYGYYDNYDLKSSHVLPALINKFHEAKISNKKFVEIWGSGKAKREFLFVDDLADAIFFILKNYKKNEFINIGSGQEVSIKTLALMIKKIVGYKGKIIFNKNMPDGTPRRIVSNNKLKKLGWKSKTTLASGILKTYNFFKKEVI